MYRFERVRQAEEMDKPGLDPEVHEIALKGLEQIAGWPGQREPLFRRVAQMAQRAGRPVRIVELGAGSGHLCRWMDGRFKEMGLEAEVIATDLHAAPGVLAADATKPRTWPRADIYFSNLTLHHLDDRLVVDLMKNMTARAPLGWLAFDLQRHWLHYIGARAAMSARGMHPILLNDGARSIQQGFTRKDLKDLAGKAGLKLEITWHFPFRWLVGFEKQENDEDAESRVHRDREAAIH